ncbi:MAG TPA: peptide chain release factor 2 [Proteobacteria bacterium]|nr:peptide chain release factor 2 [bacterium BMS3Abin14]HDL54001.1 peptide chain release factor 2 [Pseudomonadota bacterium]
MQRKSWTPSGGIFDLAGKASRLKQLEKDTIDPDFWKDQESAQVKTREISRLRREIDRSGRIRGMLDDLGAAAELMEEDKEGCPALLKEYIPLLEDAEKALSELEFESLLGDEADSRNALLTINPGAGGVESQDWAQTLFRMYVRWVERRGFVSEILDLQAAEEAGIKSATIAVEGDYAFGYLKAEIGVHRLVRISPFDANKRRHTSFASVFVYPEVEDDMEVEIEEKDLRIDTYRSSGAGGQHVNVTDSAVRITHLPTGIVVTCQNERSQHKNRATAMRILRARLFERAKRERDEKFAKLQEGKKEIAWGSQIRSYVLHPYRMVKDHRTGYESGNADAVLDGDLDGFIHAYLMETLG